MFMFFVYLSLKINTQILINFDVKIQKNYNPMLLDIKSK